MPWLACLMLVLCAMQALATVKSLRAQIDSLLQLRWELLVSPSQFWQERCHAGARQSGEVSLVRCEAKVLWHSDGWRDICDNSGKMPVFSPRHYRVAIACGLNWQDRRLVLARTEWRLFR